MTRGGLLGGRSPLLRLQSDAKLIALIRADNEAAFEQLFDRYRARLMAFCRHMLASREDAEDVMQEVFVNAYRAMRADEREINLKPWLYRIARNRSLNHLRKPVPDGQDTMDEFIGESGNSTADIAHKRADLRHLIEDVQKLPETQRTALLMREIDVLSYDQIAEAMEATVPSVKSLLVRARMSLAEATESRALTCDDVRVQLAEVTEGIRKISPPAKRHVRECEDCSQYRKMLRKTNTAMAMAFPVGGLLVVKKLVAAKFGLAALGGAKAGTGAAATGTTIAAGGAAATGVGSAAGAGAGAIITKAAVGVALTALLAGGAIEANKVQKERRAVTAKSVAPAPVTDTSTVGGASANQAKQVEEKKTGKQKAATDKTKADEDSSASTGQGTTTTPTDSSRETAGGDDVAPSTGGGSGGGESAGGAPAGDVVPSEPSPAPPSSGGSGSIDP